MPLSLQSLLQTWPYKRKDCLEHICKTQKLSPNGVADTLRYRILTHVENRPEIEEKVKDTALNFKQKEIQNNKDKYPISPVIKTTTPIHSTPVTNSSQSLFNDPRDDDYDDEDNDVTVNEADVTKQIDEFYDICEELTAEENNKKRISNSSEPITDETLEWDDDAIKNTAATNSVKTSDNNVHEKGVLISADKSDTIDHWVETIKHAMKTKDEQIDKLQSDLCIMMDINSKSIEKYNSDIDDMKEEMQTTRLLINDIWQELKKGYDERKILEDEIQYKDEQIKVLKQQQQQQQQQQHESNHNLNAHVANIPCSAQPNGPSQGHTSQPILSQESNDHVSRFFESSFTDSVRSCDNESRVQQQPLPPQQQQQQQQQQQLQQQLQIEVDPMETITNEAHLINKQISANDNKKERILIVSDSNGDLLNLHQLKPGSLVTKATRYYIKDATEQVPKMTNPDEVKDIVFQVGLNDLGHGHSPKSIQEKTLNMQIKYTEHFPNARQHITALPPLAKLHNETNQLLQKLSLQTRSNFISTKVMRDKSSGRPRANIFEGFHYNDYGIKILAKEMKKSLYSTANLNNRQLQHMVTLSSSQPTPANTDQAQYSWLH